MARIAAPSHLASGYRVVGAAERVVDKCPAQCMGGDVGQQIGTGGRADLVVDHGQAITLGSQPQHGAGKVAAARAMHPACAQDQVSAAAGADQRFTFQLGAAVDAERAGGRLFVSRLVAAAVENVVGAVVQQPAADRRHGAGQRTGGQGVDGARGVGIALGLVDGGVGAGIDHDVGPQRHDRCGQCVGLRQVTAGAWAAVAAGQGDHIAERCQGSAQFPADLAVRPQEDDFHLSAGRQAPWRQESARPDGQARKQ